MCFAWRSESFVHYGHSSQVDNTQCVIPQLKNLLCDRWNPVRELVHTLPT